MEIDLVIQSAQDGAVQDVKCVLDKLVVIGRDPDSPVQLQGTGISREHFGVEQSQGRVVLYDLSSNGTWVNGAKVEKSRPRELREGDLIEVPGYRISVKLPLPPAPVAPPPTAPPAPAPEPLPEPAPAPMPVVAQNAPVEEPPAKASFLQPVKNALGALTLLEKLLIIAAVASLWMGITYYNG